MGTPVSQRAYARHRGVTHRAVQKAIAAGRIPVTADKKVDPEAADIAWASNTDESKPRNSVSGTPRLSASSLPATTPITTGNPSSYQNARALHEAYRAKTARVEYERLTGTLVSVEEVRLQAFTTARHLREALLSLPDRLAPVLAAMNDPAEIHRTLVTELRQALKGLLDAQRE